MYAIIDIETTGGSPKHERITEIAIYVHDGKKVVKEFVSLINPERAIPPFITRLTGISNDMVADAPRFFEVAKDIVELTEDCIFVAHNASFDYGFVKEEFKRLGYNYKKECLCTVKTSRKLIPGKASYSLGKLCDELGIQIEDRHRAAGDALATVKLFELLLSVDGKNETKSQFDKFALKGLNPNLDREILKKLPDEVGVYYFHDEDKEVIYVGKSNNIQKRVISHFNNDASQRYIEMKARIADISYETTGSELVALLLESSEIKKLKPIYNRAQRRKISSLGLHSYTDQNGYIRLFIDKNVKTSNPLMSFSSKSEGKQFLYRIIDEFELCQKLCDLYKSESACFQHGIGLCKGACVGIESNEDYNERVKLFIERYKFESANMYIIDQGRHSEERSVVKVESGKYCGFGYFAFEEGITDLNQLNDCIQLMEDNRDVQQIIRSFIGRNNVERIIKY
ncbi:MAG: exonuclease [Marinilabiliales bacterium]|nr:MAG: exonuclease [Marinilabiliales bacterium]